VSLHDRLYQSWLLQLQTWSAGSPFSAGVDALRLMQGQGMEQLNHIASRLLKVNARNVSPIEVLRGSSTTPSAAKEAALIP